MKRLFAMLALLAGGLANEAVHPLVCTLAPATRRENLEADDDPSANPNERRRRLARRASQCGV
ncbi:hypothetical protein F4827_003200 [Paraburkholderia bannensis]|uniref:Uncharacterized protein n=1 Tax=Paraburkholderia bannensis TaxID=765414 RepID=A0A7W9TZZ5_9BURK|nr:MULTISPECIES: hypothetical protein [Paraburkholderia]MBB3258332.1 hypothetical protein [Paraburkholderia sp. WP4_3_2]MBB6103345.1 hypothetical protein [Paraburkholderia bannensis]